MPVSAPFFPFSARGAWKFRSNGPFWDCQRRDFRLLTVNHREPTAATGIATTACPADPCCQNPILDRPQTGLVCLSRTETQGVKDETLV